MPLSSDPGTYVPEIPNQRCAHCWRAIRYNKWGGWLHVISGMSPCAPYTSAEPAIKAPSKPAGYLVTFDEESAEWVASRSDRPEVTTTGLTAAAALWKLDDSFSQTWEGGF